MIHARTRRRSASSDGRRRARCRAGAAQPRPPSRLPQPFFYAYVLYRSGRLDEVRSIVDEIFVHWAEGEAIVIQPIIDEVVMLSELVGSARARQLLELDAPTPRRDAALAATDGDYLRAADGYARQGKRVRGGTRSTARSGAARRTRAAGRGRRPARACARDVHRTLGAARDVREAEALLAAIA